MSLASVMRLLATSPSTLYSLLGLCSRPLCSTPLTSWARKYWSRAILAMSEPSATFSRVRQNSSAWRPQMWCRPAVSFRPVPPAVEIALWIANGMQTLTPPTSLIICSKPVKSSSSTSLMKTPVCCSTVSRTHSDRRHQRAVDPLQRGRSAT